jgi:hypothetical protein
MTTPSSPSAPLADFAKKVSKTALAAALEKLDRKYLAGGANGAKLYPPAPTMPHISAPPVEEKEKPSEASTRALETAQEKLHNKFYRANNIAPPPSMTVDVALEKLHNKFRGNTKREEKQSELNENQKGM